MLRNVYVPSTSCLSKAFATRGRWYPQPVYEMSHHRSRPPSSGLHRRSRVLVVDNSALGKEANSSGRLAYAIWVYKMGYRKRHMPHATLGDTILVAICGEMKKALVVGAKVPVYERKHGVPSTDINSVVLLTDDGNPLGNRVLSPLPSVLLKKRNDMIWAKALALGKRFF